MAKIIHHIDHPQIKDWPKRPYKTIAIIFLLLLSGMLFTGLGIEKYLTDHTYDVYVPFISLGVILLIPGVYYTFILINIWLGREDYDYELVPDMNE